jgi:hypothetical protein
LKLLIVTGVESDIPIIVNIPPVTVAMSFDGAAGGFVSVGLSFLHPEISIDKRRKNDKKRCNFIEMP